MPMPMWLEKQSLKRVSEPIKREESDWLANWKQRKIMIWAFYAIILSLN